ncbi:MAG: DUF481 domain-containing protein [Treponema sp.]|jgi:hypothetical protein|nr:DUF481 domain-containing protein [Treponema sp.]
MIQYNLLSKGGDKEKKAALFIKEINKGSIIVELASAFVPLLSDANTVFAFYTSIKSIFDWLSAKLGAKPNRCCRSFSPRRLPARALTSAE